MLTIEYWSKIIQSAIPISFLNQTVLSLIFTQNCCRPILMLLALQSNAFILWNVSFRVQVPAEKKMFRLFSHRKCKSHFSCIFLLLNKNCKRNCTVNLLKMQKNVRPFSFPSFSFCICYIERTPQSFWLWPFLYREIAVLNMMKLCNKQLRS